MLSNFNSSSAKKKSFFLFLIYKVTKSPPLHFELKLKIKAYDTNKSCLDKSPIDQKLTTCDAPGKSWRDQTLANSRATLHRKGPPYSTKIVKTERSLCIVALSHLSGEVNFSLKSSLLRKIEPHPTIQI